MKPVFKQVVRPHWRRMDKLLNDGNLMSDEGQPLTLTDEWYAHEFLIMEDIPQNILEEVVFCGRFPGRILYPKNGRTWRWHHQ